MTLDESFSSYPYYYLSISSTGRSLDNDLVRVASNSGESLTELIEAAIHPIKLEMEVLRGKLPA